MQLVTSMADFTQSLPAALAQTTWLWETNAEERVMARQHAGTAVISEGHKEVVNIRTAGAASKCSAGNAIRVRPNSLKPLFGKPLHITHLLFLVGSSDERVSSLWRWQLSVRCFLQCTSNVYFACEATFFSTLKPKKWYVQLSFENDVLSNWLGHKLAL